MVNVYTNKQKFAGELEVIFEKIGFEIKEIYKSSTGIMDIHEFVDSHPTNGANLYRVKIKLSDGRLIYSAVNTVYYTGSSTYTLYPVPAVRGSVIKLLQKQANDIYVQITDATGRIVHQQFFSDTYNEIDTDRLPKGLYILKITDEQGIKKLYRIILI